MVRPDQHVPILVFLQNERDRRFDGRLQLARGGCELLFVERRADLVDGVLQFSNEPLGSRAQPVGFGLR